MPNTKSSKRSSIKSKTQRKHNINNKSMLRTFIKKVNLALKKDDKKHAMSAFLIMQKTIDRHTAKGLIHKNKAARYKSNIFKRIKCMF